MKKMSDAIRVYAERLQPQLRLFYRAAHAVTGSRAPAESVLSNAVLKAYLNRGEWRERMSFREGVLHAIWIEGREMLKKETEADWDWPGVSQDADGTHPLIDLLSNEPPETQRIMVLRYGCSLTAREIAALTGENAEQIRERLSRCQVRAERWLTRREISCKPFDRYASQQIRQWMNRENSEPIDVGYFLATFEKDAVGAHQPRRIAVRILRAALTTLAAIVLAVMIWLVAILMEI